jgi:hypothetical protein
MFQVRFHGRGGQGVVTAAELLASAGFLQARYAHLFRPQERTDVIERLQASADRNIALRPARRTESSRTATGRLEAKRRETREGLCGGRASTNLGRSAG